MHITIKLSKEEATALSNFKKAMVPPEVGEEQFSKTIFFLGLQHYHDNMMEMMQKYAEENADALRAEGVDVDAIVNDTFIDEDKNTD